LKGDATHWLTDPEYAVLRHRLEAAHAAAEAALVEARRRVRIDEGRSSGVGTSAGLGHRGGQSEGREPAAPGPHNFSSFASYLGERTDPL
jgi:hypothetical protein